LHQDEIVNTIEQLTDIDKSIESLTTFLGCAILSPKDKLTIITFKGENK